MLQLANIKKSLAHFELQLSIELPDTEIIGILGVSGSGKTSLINLISGFLIPDQGSICFNGRILTDKKRAIFVPPAKREMAYIFQEARLFPHYTVLKNLTYSRPKATTDRIEQVVELLNISLLLKRYPRTLSGGEQQRVAIGRALLSSPKLLLMDEPLAALDIPRKQELLHYLQQLSIEINIPILYVTHSLQEVKALAKKVIVMQEGKIAAMTSCSEITHHPVFLPWLQGHYALV